MKLNVINKRLENLLAKADIQETLTLGSAVNILPSEKELSRLAHLSGELCKLRRQSCKCAAGTFVKRIRKSNSGSHRQYSARAI